MDRKSDDPQILSEIKKSKKSDQDAGFLFPQEKVFAEKGVKTSQCKATIEIDEENSFSEGDQAGQGKEENGQDGSNSTTAA